MAGNRRRRRGSYLGGSTIITTPASFINKRMHRHLAERKAWLILCDILRDVKIPEALRIERKKRRGK